MRSAVGWEEGVPIPVMVICFFAVSIFLLLRLMFIFRCFAVYNFPFTVIAVYISLLYVFSCVDLTAKK